MCTVRWGRGLRHDVGAAEGGLITMRVRRSVAVLRTGGRGRSRGVGAGSGLLGRGGAECGAMRVARW